MAASRFSVEAVFKAVDRISNPLKKMGLNSKKFTKTIRRDFAKAQRAVKRFSNNMKRRFQALGRNLIRFGGLAIAAGIAGIAAGIGKMATEADKLAKTSRQIGMTAEQLQELQFAADRQGVSVETLTKSLEKLNRNVGDLRAGTGTLTTFLNKTNPALAEQLKNVTSNEEAFNLLTREINALPNQFDKSALSVAAFGRAGIDMLKLLEAGPDGIAALRNEAQSYGLISNQTAADSEKFVDALTNLKAVGKGLFTSFASNLIPVFTEFLTKVKDLITNNKDLIKKGFEKFVKIGKKVFEVVKAIVKVFIDIVKFLKPILPVILGVVAAFTAYNAVLTIMAIKQAIVNAVTNASVFGLIVIAIAALIAIIILLVENWDKVKEVATNVWNAIVGAVQGAVESIVNFIDGLIGGIIDALNGVVNFIGNVVGGVKKFLGIKTDINATQTTVATAAQIAQGEARRGGVVTQGDRVSRAISETTNRTEVIVKNDGTSTVQTDSGTIPPGGSIVLPASG